MSSSAVSVHCMPATHVRVQRVRAADADGLFQVGVLVSVLVRADEEDGVARVARGVVVALRVRRAHGEPHCAAPREEAVAIEDELHHAPDARRQHEEVVIAFEHREEVVARGDEVPRRAVEVHGEVELAAVEHSPTCRDDFAVMWKDKGRVDRLALPLDALLSVALSRERVVRTVVVWRPVDLLTLAVLVARHALRDVDHHPHAHRLTRLQVDRVQRVEALRLEEVDAVALGDVDLLHHGARLAQLSALLLAQLQDDSAQHIYLDVRAQVEGGLEASGVFS